MVDQPTTSPTAEPTEAPSPTPESAEVVPTTAPAEEATSSAQSAPGVLPDIYSFTLQQPETRTFAELLERLHLIERLQSDESLTAFVPTTNAFARLPISLLENDEQMTEIILFHVVPNNLTIDRLFSEVSAPSLLGEALSIWSSESNVVVENANVLGVTDQVARGTLYIVDNVMLPPHLSDYGVEQNQVAGEESFPTMGNLHIDMGARSPQQYNSLPPTSGPHYPSIVAWEIYEEPIRYEHLVHNLEDGGVVLYYQCEEACPELVAQLKSVVQPYVDEGRHVVMVPNQPSWTVNGDSTLHRDIGVPIAVAAWRKLLKLDAFDAERITAFIDAYEGIDHHAKY